MPKSTTFLGNFCRGFKFYHFSSEIILGNFYKHLAIFIWSHWSPYAFKALEVDWSFLCTSFELMLPLYVGTHYWNKAYYFLI